MLKGLGLFAARITALFLLTAPAYAGNTLFLDSQAGDPVGQGKVVTYTDATGSFSGGNKASNSTIVFTYSQSNPFVNWTLEFTQPSGGSFAPGIYDYVQTPGLVNLQTGGLLIIGNGSLCNPNTGRYVIRDIATDGTGKITSIAIDFEQICPGSSGSLFGSLRYNDTTPVPFPDATADAGLPQRVTQGDTVTLNGTLSDAGSGSITSYAWTQTGGTPVALSDPSAVTPTFTAPAVSADGDDLTFQLQVNGTVGTPSTSAVTIHVRNPADPISRFSLTGDPGDPFENGTSFAMDDGQGTFKAIPLEATVSVGAGVQVTESLTGSNPWTFQFAVPVGQTLQVGQIYDGALRYPFGGSTVAQLSVTGRNTGCGSLTGRFVILDLQTDGSGNIVSFAADFEQHCGGIAPALHGQVRFNSTVSLDDAWADAGGAQLVYGGMPVTLSGSGSQAGQGDSISSYQWVQISGPTVTLSDATAANPTFSAPAVMAGGADLVFQLTVSNADGSSSVDTVTVHVANTSDAVSIMHVASQTGDKAGGGVTTDLNSAQSVFKVSGGTNQLVVTVNSGYSNPWTLLFSAPPGQVLAVGTYTSAEPSPWNSNSNSPGMQVYTGNGANECTGAFTPGQFTIRDLQTDGSGKVTAFAADFVQQCSNSTGGLHGEVRYNSTMPAFGPTADAGPFQSAVEGSTVTVSAAASDPGDTGLSLSSYQWMQLSGPTVVFSDATAQAPTFTAPAVAPGGADLMLQVSVTNSLGISDSASVTIHVADSTDPSPSTVLYAVADVGYPQLGGQTFTVNGTAQTFLISKNSTATQLAAPDWEIDLAPPKGQTLQMGKTYKLAQDALFPTAALPGLDVFVNGDGDCPPVNGRFVILQQETDATGHTLALAVDFEEDCGATALHGAYRYNSSVALSAPFADAGDAQIVQQGATVNLDGSHSYAGGGNESITSYAWNQLSGPTVILSDATVAAPSFTAPTVSAGGADLVFQLTVTNTDGRTESDTVNVHVANPADPITALRISGDPGDFVSQGKTWNENTLLAAFSAQKIKGGSAVDVSVDGGSYGEWSIRLVAPLGQLLQVGNTYTGAQRTGFQSPGNPGLEVTGNSLGCDTISGNFVIKDISVAVDGTLQSLAADMVQHCEGHTPALYGKIRYNSTYTIDDPVANAGTEQAAQQGDTVTLDGSATDPGGDGTTVTSWQWIQIGGPSVDLSGADSQSATFVPGDVPPGGETLVFQLTVTNSLGLTSTQDVTVLVANPSDPQNGIYIQGQSPVDSSPNVQALLRQPVDGTVTATTPSTNAVTVAYQSPDGGFWHLTFVPPQGQQFQVGAYTTIADADPNDTGIGKTPGPQAELLVTNSNFDDCAIITGHFKVEQVSYDGNGNVTAFAADFKQVCAPIYFSPNPHIMRGEVRYNSNVTLREPLADAGLDHLGMAGMPASLDGSASSTPYGTMTSYAWTQIVNSGDPAVTLSNPAAIKPTFTAPNIATGRTLTFQLTVTNSVSLTNQDVVHLMVIGLNDPKTAFYYQSDADDPDGQGATTLATTDDAQIFSIGANDDANLNVDPTGTTPFDQFWQFTFSNGGDVPLQKGVYPVGAFTGFKIPSMIATAGACDQTGGLFVVRDVAFSGFTLTRLAADFVRHCQGATGDLRGALRYNSTVPMLVNTPAANPGPSQIVTSAGIVTLDGSTSFPGWSNTPHYSWRQLSGPAVVLTGINKPVMQFNVPASLVTLAGNTWVFSLTVSNSSGLPSTARVTVTAKQPDVNLLALQSDAGDPMGQGQTLTLNPIDTAITATKRLTNDVHVGVQANPSWTLDFAAANRQLLTPGVYSGAVLQSLRAGASPGLYVDTPLHSCHAVSGSFTVLDVQYGKGSVINSLAVDFSQTCNGAPGALHGKLRFHSAVP